MNSPSPKAAIVHPLNIVVLSGGMSAERTVSMASGEVACQSLRQLGHHVTNLDPSEPSFAQFDWSSTDVCFIALHGLFGEDGQVQQLLEQIGIPYTGSNSQTSRVTINKIATKKRFSRAGIPTPEYISISNHSGLMTLDTPFIPFNFPVIVKPSDQGSSIGVTVVFRKNELQAAIERASHWNSDVLIEPYITGKELTVTVLDRLALPVIEILSPKTIFDYEAKYQDTVTDYSFDIELPTLLLTRIQNLAAEACSELRTSGLCRVDLLVDKDENPWFLEINTIPGMTSHSLAPMASARAGIQQNQLFERLIQKAMDRARHTTSGALTLS